MALITYEITASSRNKFNKIKDTISSGLTSIIGSETIGGVNLIGYKEPVRKTLGKLILGKLIYRVNRSDTQPLSSEDRGELKRYFSEMNITIEIQETNCI